MFAIRQAQWKLEFCPGSGGWGTPGDPEAAKQGLPPIQLYDVSSDVAEAKNVQAQNPEVVARLTKLLDRYVADGRSTPGPKQANDVSVIVNKTDTKKGKAARKEAAGTQPSRL